MEASSRRSFERILDRKGTRNINIILDESLEILPDGRACAAPSFEEPDPRRKMMRPFFCHIAMKAFESVATALMGHSSQGRYQVVDSQEHLAVEMAGVSRRRSAVDEPANLTVSLSVKGMTCAACSGAVEKALQ